MEDWSLYRGAPPALRTLGLACVGAGEQEGPLKSFSSRVLDTHALVAVSAGRGAFRLGSRSWEIREPSLIWIFPGAVHGYGPDTGGWREHWMLFTGSAVRAYEEMGAFSRDNPLQTMPEGFPLTAFRELGEALGEDGPRGDLHAGVVAQRLLLAAMAPGHRTSADADDHLIAELRKLACLPLGMVALAARLGHTPASLRSAVQRVSGTGPKELVLAIRLSRAQALLANGELPIARIARAVGYRDSAYFSRLFSQKVGQSPSNFRASHMR